MNGYILKAQNIIAGEDLVQKENAAVQVEDGKITRIYDSVSEIPQDCKAEVIDLGAQTLIPGMIDCHNHLALDTRLENHLVKMNDPECEQTIRALKTMKDDLVSGVTTARCLGDRFYIDVIFYKDQ